MTPSIGVSIFPDHGDNFEHLLKNSDTAMYQSKAEEPGQYKFFSEQMKTEAIEKVAIENGLREALKQDGLQLHFQPKFDVARGKITGAEALLRWTDPRLGSIPPGRFIPIAEESGLIRQVNRWVISSACRQIVAWRETNIDIPIAINMSAIEFLHGDPVSLLVDVCESYDVNPSMLEIEITESTLMANVSKATQALNRLNELGFRLSVDDFGTGYSSLAYLKRFNVDVLKIDQSFVTDVANDADDAAICNAVIALANSLNLSVVAEGVETPEQYNWLVTHGCECVQGYFFGRPMPDADFELLFQETNCAADGQVRVAV